jgi:hypothetical protein
MIEVALKDYRFILDYFELEKLIAFKFRDSKNTFDYLEELWRTPDLQDDMEEHIIAELGYVDYRLTAAYPKNLYGK